MGKKLIMRSIYLVKVVILASIIFWSCAPAKSGRTSDKGKIYQEDLSVHRPKYELIKPLEGDNLKDEANKANVKPLNDVTLKANALMDSIAARNKENKYFSGYTVQVYAGNSRDAAVQAKERIYRSLPNSEPEISYIQPNYRVKVGKFIERLEAQRFFMEIKSDFPNAIIIPEKISIEK